MEELPFEIIAQILSFLPVKSLLRFKCVSKSLYSLIKNPNFIKLHLNQALISTSSSHRHLLLCGKSSLYSAELDVERNNHLSSSELHLPFTQAWCPSSELHLTFDLTRFNMIGSCNGVICISNTTPLDIFLYNPLTRSHFYLPKIPIPKLHNRLVLFGFGYDSMTDDYKVLRVFQGYAVDDGRHDFRHESKVFSLKNGSWRTIQSVSTQCVFAGEDTHGCLVNEVLHFIVFKKKLNAQYKRIFIACFDLRTDTFSILDYCPPWEHKRVDESTDLKTLALYLRELRGCLSVINLFYVENPAQAEAEAPDKFLAYRADLWVMKEYGNKGSWVRLFSLRFGELASQRVMLMPILCSNDGRKLLVHMDCTYFEWYDLASNNAERLTIDGMPNEYVDARVFVGSLVSFGS